MKSRAMLDQIKTMRQSGCSIRKIASALCISRNTVRTHLRREQEAPVDESLPLPVGPGWCRDFDWPAVVSERRRGTTASQLYREYEPPVSYSRFCRLLREQARLPTKPACALDHVPAERTQLDYADGVWIFDRKTGTKKKSHLFCGVLPFSSRTYAEFAADQKLPSFIRSQERMWAYFGGVTPYVVIDNLKSGVKKAHRYDPEVNPTYCDFANKTGCAVLPARPYTPRDKAAVEAAIGVIQRDFFQKVRNEKFYSLAEANAALRRYIDELNSNVMPDHGVSRMDRFEKESGDLLPLPGEPYEIVEWRKSKVHPDCCIEVARALYSVPFRHCGQTVRVKIGTKLVEIFNDDLERLACHARQPRHGRSVADEHLPPTKIQASSFEIKKSMTQAEAIGPKTLELVRELLSGERPLRYLRRVQGIMRLRSDLSSDALEYASTQALTFKRYQLAYIKSCAQYFRETGGRLATVTLPDRDPNTLHLHGG